MFGTRVPRYHNFQLTFEPNTLGRERGRLKALTTVRAYGWKDALNQADREFDLDRVRFVNHPSNDGVATAYVDTNAGDVPFMRIVGQVTAQRVPSGV